MPSSSNVLPAISKQLGSPALVLALVVLCTACGGGGSSGGGGGGRNGGGGGGKITTPPAQPTDMTPINGEAYYVLNQSSGLQGDLINNSTTPGDHVIQQARSFSHLSQRWAVTALTGGGWKISNVSNGFCLDSASSSGNTWIVQNPCAASATQQWMLSATSNGYYIIAKASTGLLVDVISQATGAWLNGSSLAGNPTQSQQWLLRPAFFRSVDNALLEKQESAHSKNGVP